MKKLYRFETRAIHSGEDPDTVTGSLRTPIDMSSSYKLPDFGPKLFDALMMDSDDPPFAYTRWGNPTLRSLEEKVASMEGAEAGIAFATGMAAISALIFSLLGQGDHLIANDVCYAGSVELFGDYLKRYGIEVSLVNTSDPEQIKNAIRENTKLIYIETPSNPILRIVDIGAVSAIARESGIPLAVDSTFAGPVIQRPIDSGADYVIHSMTKYMCGHGDALGGIIVGKRDEIKRIRKEMLVHLGGAMSPFNAWLIMRGIVTLPLRMERHSSNALTLAEFLEGHKAVSRVIYPGLSSHPHHDVAAANMNGFGGMMTVQLRGGLGSAINLAEKIKVFRYATSLGHAHSLMFYYPTDMYIDAVSYLTDEQKKDIREWTGEGIVRISVGLENVNDLIEDVDSALKGRTIKGIAAPLAYRLMK